jgi:HAD superfamily hydrolase (TIGR01548 family)
VSDGARFDVDTVVLDVDGVLVDVRASFREAVRETVVVVQREMGVAEPWRPSHGDINALKRAGGFNDDIDISIALAALGAAGRGDDMRHVASAVETAGGGLSALRSVAPDLPRVAGRRVLEVFDALYWGDHANDGLISRERMLVGPDYPELLRAAGARHIACISGRAPRELDAALAKLGWDKGTLSAVVTGDMVRKPDPSCLDPVVRACSPRAMVYVGDVRDDWELVVRYRAAHPDGPPIRGILVGSDEEMSSYRALGVDAILPNALDVPDVLRRWREATAPSATR